MRLEPHFMQGKTFQKILHWILSYTYWLDKWWLNISGQEGFDAAGYGQYL